jgi:AbiU2
MQKNIPMPPALQEKLNAIDLEVRNLHFKWRFFSQLFTDPNRVKILNAAAASLFQSVEDSMLSDILLSIMRLTDPSKSMGQENLSFENLIQEMPNGSLRTEVVNLLSQIKQKTKDIKTWRDKKLSHNDLQKALGSFSLPQIQKKDLTDTLGLIPQIMNLIHGHFTDTEVKYEMCITSQDGDSLLFYLEYGLDVWEEDKLNHNVDRIHKLRKKHAENKDALPSD